MKRKLLSGVFAGILTLALAMNAPPAHAAARTVPVTVDGVLLDGTSYLSDGVTYVPLRYLCDTLGGWQVSWRSDNRTAEAVLDDSKITANPASGTVHVNDTPTGDGTFLKDGRTYIPLRAVCEALDMSVEWNRHMGGATVETGDGIADTGSEANTDFSSINTDANPSVGSELGNNEVTTDTSVGTYNEEDLYWLSRIISAESQGECLEGQIAVGNVVLNRVKSDAFPNTITGVIFDTVDGVQFEPVSNGTVYNEPTEQSVEAAKAALDGVDIVGECLYFYNPALSQGIWINANRTYYTTIGCHRFYL